MEIITGGKQGTPSPSRENARMGGLIMKKFYIEPHYPFPGGAAALRLQ